MYTRCNYTACCDSRVILIRFLLEKPCICMRLVSAQKYDAQSGWYMHCTCATVDFKGRLELEGSKYMCILILSKLFSSTYIASFLLNGNDRLNISTRMCLIILQRQWINVAHVHWRHITSCIIKICICVCLLTLTT